jgi:hypothetical protein
MMKSSGSKFSWMHNHEHVVRDRHAPRASLPW